MSIALTERIKALEASVKELRGEMERDDLVARKLDRIEKQMNTLDAERKERQRVPPRPKGKPDDK